MEPTWEAAKREFVVSAIETLETPIGTPASGPDSLNMTARRILLVVGDPMIHLNLSSRLRLAGFEVSVTSGTEMAIQKFHSYNPHAVVLDMVVNDDSGDEVIRELRRNPDGKELPIYAFSSSPNSKAVRRAVKSGATKLFTDSATPFDDIIVELTTEHSQQIPDGEIPEAPDAAAKHAVENKIFLNGLRSAIARVQKHLEVLLEAESNHGRSVAYGELRGKLQTVLPLARQSVRPGVYRLAGALHALLKVLHEMPECATETTQRTVIAAIDVLGRLCDGDKPPLESKALDLSAAIGDEDMVSRSVVCSALRSVGFQFECFAHFSLVMPYLENGKSDLVIVHLAPDSSPDSDFGKKLRAKSKTSCVPVILVHGVSDFEDQAPVTKDTMDELITKPFIFMELSVKALTLALKKRLAIATAKLEAASGSTAVGSKGSLAATSEAAYEDNSFGIAQYDDSSMASTPGDIGQPKLPPSRFKGSAISEAEDLVGEGATAMLTLREELDQKRRERERLVSRIFNTELELEQLNTALEEEREHRQQLEQMVQDLMVGQVPPTPGPATSDPNASFQADASHVAAETADDSLANLQMQIAELNAETDILKNELQARHEEREQLAARIYQDEQELEAVRKQLEEERSNRVASEALPDDQQSTDGIAADEATAELRKTHDELVAQLAAAQQENEAEFRNRAELEVKLEELTNDLNQARVAQQNLEAERDRLEAEFEQKLAETRQALEADQSNQAAQAQLQEQLQQELALVRDRQATLEEALTKAEAEASENTRLKSELEEQLLQTQQALEQARAEQEKAITERAEVVNGLRDQLDQLTKAADQAEAARTEEVERRNKLQAELDQLWKAQEEIDQQLASEKTNAAEADSRQQELQARLQEASQQLEQSHRALQEAEELKRSEADRRAALEKQLAQVQEELDAKLNAQSQLAAETNEQKADLENRLKHLEEELPQARQKISELTQEKERVQAEFANQLKAATEATALAEEKARKEVARSEELESDLAKNRDAAHALKARLETQQDRIAETLAAREDLEQKLNSATAEIDAAIAARQKLIEEHNTVVAQLEERLQKAEQNANQVRQDLEKESNRNQQLRAEAEKLQASRDELEKRLQAESEKHQQSATTLSQLEQKLAQKSAEHEDIVRRLKELENSKSHAEAELGQKLEATTQELTSAQNERESAKQRALKLGEEIEHLQKAKESLEASLTDERNALSQAKERGNRFETKLSQVQVLCDELNGKLSAEQEATASLTREKAELEQRLAAETKAWQAAKQNSEQQVATWKQRDAEYNRERNALRTAAAEAEEARKQELARANKFEAEVTELWQVRDDLKARVASGQKIIGDLHQQRAALERQLEEVATQLEQTRNDLASLQNNLRAVEEKSQHLADENAALKSEAAVSAEKQRLHETELASMDRRVRDTIASLARTTAELESERGDRRRIEQRAAGLSAQLQDLHRELNSHLEIERENKTRLTELEQEIAERVNELNAERTAGEKERGERRNVEQRAAALASQIESLREELIERQKLEKENQSRISNLEQQLRAREESLVRVTQHLETEREERRRVEQRAEALVAQTQKLQDELAQSGQREKEQLNRITQLEEHDTKQSSEIDRLQNGLAGERSERTKSEDRAKSLAAQLRDLHNELNEHLRMEKEAGARISELEGQLHEKQSVITELQSDLEKESSDREMAEEQLRAAGDIAGKLKQYQSSFDDARKAFETTQRELESRLEVAATELREQEATLEKEQQEKSALKKALETAQREVEQQNQQKSIELSKLQSALLVESMERRRLEGDAMHSRYASLQSSRSGRTLVNGFRRQLEKPVDQVMQNARKMLSFEMNESLKEVAEALLESAVTLQNNVRECDMVEVGTEPAPTDESENVGNPATTESAE